MKTCVEKISPIANRAVIFTTDATSYHGHPEPMQCPEDVARRSLALYYSAQRWTRLSVRPSTEPVQATGRTGFSSSPTNTCCARTTG